jgi:nitronate monooxygenase
MTALELDYPIIQGPMNGASTLELTAEVSNAGALGSFSASSLSPDDIHSSLQQLRRLTTRSFSVNLFLLEPPQVDRAQLEDAQALLAPIRAELGLGPATPPAQYCQDYRAQIAALLEQAPPVVSFTFGLLDAATVAQFQRGGTRVIGTATTVAEARAWERVGADYICAAGSEAGGHRPSFLGEVESSCVGLMALLPQVRAAVRVPVIAAGGMMNGQGIAAALLLGAQAAQLGTAFLCCPESGIAPAWREALQQAGDDSTRLTRTFSGKYARGIINRFMQQMHACEALVPPYPIQNVLTAEIRQASARQGKADFMSLWAGQGVGLARPMPAAQLVRTLAQELQASGLG